MPTCIARDGRRLGAGTGAVVGRGGGGGGGSLFLRMSHFRRVREWDKSLRSRGIGGAVGPRMTLLWDRARFEWAESMARIPKWSAVDAPKLPHVARVALVRRISPMSPVRHFFQ